MGVLIDNHTGDAVDPGGSFWQKRTGSSATLIYTNETFQTNWGSDTYMSAWALSRSPPGSGGRSTPGRPFS